MKPINYIKRADLLYVSIFYPRDAWHKLIKRAVVPFLELSAERYEVDYICHFNTFKGDAINFTILPKHNKKDFVLFFHEYFQQYLHEHPSSYTRDHEEFESVFMDFPTNSLQYGLHDFPFSGRRRFDRNMLLALQETSSIILDALSKAGSTFDIMTLALHIYSNLSIQDQIFSKNAGALNGKNTNTQLQDLLDIQYDENKELVEQVVLNNYNIIHKKKVPAKYNWLIRWSDLTKKLFEDSLENNLPLSQGISKNSFIAYSKIQLGLTQDEDVLIQYFVKKALHQSLYPNH